MKAANHFYSNFPPHLLSVVPTEAVENKEIVSTLKSASYIWPEITREDHKKTLDNYRAYIQAVNDAIPNLNAKIDIYNDAVVKNIKEHPVTPNKEILIKLFVSKFNALPDREYNEAVESFNENHGKYFKQRKFQPVRPVSLQVFEAMLHAYTVQLKNFVRVWKDTGKHTATPLPKYELNPHHITTQERGEGVINLDISSRTARRHRDRLEEVGVLHLKEYRGRKRPVEYFIADTILSVSEGYLPKMQNTQNQPPNPDQRTECQQVKVTTRTNRNKEEIKGIVNNSLEGKARASLTSKLVFYKTTNLQGGEKQTGAAAKNGKPGEKNVKVLPKETSAEKSTWINLVNALDTRYDLAQKLANGEFNYYTPLSMTFLNDLLKSSMADNDYRDLLVQDFIKSAASVNRHDQARAGSWYNALGYINTDFGCINFAGHAMNKQASLAKLVEFRYRLNWALNWFNKRDWTELPYASRYFDPSRTLPSDISWQYTTKIWSKKMQKIAKTAADKKRKAVEAAKRKSALSTDRKSRQKLDNAIYRYLRNELNFVELTAYAVRELPKKQQGQLGERLQELTMRRLTKTK